MKESEPDGLGNVGGKCIDTCELIAGTKDDIKPVKRQRNTMLQDRVRVETWMNTVS